MNRPAGPTPNSTLTWLARFELLSYVVTVVGMPFAIAVFMWEQRRARQNDQEEIYPRVSDEYTNFPKLVPDNTDLRLLRHEDNGVPLDVERQERRHALFSILASRFERAYMPVYETKMGKQTRRLWQSWEDYMREWCRRPGFRDALPQLLPGEDAEPVALTVPPGTAAGTHLRVRGQGLPREDGNRGDLFAVVQLSMPTAVGPEEHVLWEKIAALSTFNPRRSP